MSSTKAALRLAENTDDRGDITAFGADRLVETVGDFAGIARSSGCGELMAFATSAVRDANNSEAVLTLPLKEFDLLEYLLRNSGRVLTRGQLIDRVWGADYVGDTKTLDVHVKRLRAKIEGDPGKPKHLVTVRGLGYKLEE